MSTVEMELQPEQAAAVDPSRVRRWKRYPAYRDSGVEWLGEVPAGWVVAPLYSRYEVQLGKMLNAEASEGQMRAAYLRNTNVQWDFVDVSDLRTMSFDVREREKFSLRAGDLLVCEGGEVGRTAMWRGEVEECFFQKAIHRVRASRPGEVPRFLFYILWAASQTGVFIAEGNKSTIIHLTAEKLKKHRYAFPPAIEQRAIAAFLDCETARIDVLVAKKERLIELLQEKRTALISHAVTKGLDPDAPMRDSGVEWLGEVPAGWEVKKFKYSCRIPNGQVNPESEAYNELVLIAPNHVESGTGRILYTETAQEQGAMSGKYLVTCGDLIYSKIRPALNKVCIAESAWLCSADMYPVIPRNTLLPRFLLYFLLSDGFVRLMVDESMRVAMPKVNREALGNASLLIPPLPEQRAIAAFLDRENTRIDALVAKIRDHIARLQEYRTALISAAVTGKIDVRGEVA